MTEWRTWHSTKQNSCRGRETREALFCLLPFFLYIFVDLRLQLNAHTPTRFKTLKWFFFCCRPCYRIIQLFRCCCKRSVVSAQDVNSVPSNRQGYITRQNENDTTIFSYRADETFPPSLEGRREPTLWIWSRLKRVVNFFFYSTHASGNSFAGFQYEYWWLLPGSRSLDTFRERMAFSRVNAWNRDTMAPSSDKRRADCSLSANFHSLDALNPYSEGTKPLHTKFILDRLRPSN